MPIKTIHVCLTTSRHAATLMRMAVPLARAHGARLTGLHTLEALEVYPGVAMHIPDQAFGAFNKAQAEEAAAIERIFNACCEAEEISYEWRQMPAQAVSAADRLVESCRAADLVIMSRDDKSSDRFDQRNVQERMIRESGRPVLIIPLDYEGPVVGQNILLGWSNCAEAARAAHDVVAVARAGASVNILHVGPSLLDELTDYDAIDIAGMFARHGIGAELTRLESSGRDVSALLCSEALGHEADMIATGAFGHSRIHDFVVGSVTLSLLHHAELPVMFSG